jgi:general secretion pathway protein C
MGSINKNWIIYLSSVTVISFLLADMTSLVLGSKLEASASLLPKGSPDNPHAVSFPASEQTALIIEGNIFNSKLRGKKEALASSVPLSPPIPNLQARFRLVGTSEGPPEVSFAIIEDLQSKEQVFYHLNDRLLDQVRIAQIQRNQVRLAYVGGSETLHLQLDEERSAVPPPPPPGAAPANSSPLGGDPHGIRKLASNKWVLDRHEVEHNLDNLNLLMTQARVIPNFSDGKPDGFRVFAIVPDSFYEKIGLKNGDVLERVNGVEIKDPESFLKVFQHLKDENNINLDVVRNSQKETMSYEIR